MPTPTSTRIEDPGRDAEEAQPLVITGTDDNAERLVKSVARVRDLGEVFTPAATIKAMLDLLPVEMWEPHPSATFFEPSCGDGNFLLAVLGRKLRAIARRHAQGALPAGSDEGALLFHSLEAMASIHAVDISPDNVIGGTPGHEVGARERLFEHLRRWYATEATSDSESQARAVAAAGWIVKHNVLVGNMLAVNADGTPSGRERLPLIEYEWEPAAREVTLLTTTLGAVMDAACSDTSEMMLFGPADPSFAWHGPAFDVVGAPIPAPGTGHVDVRNRHARRTRLR